MSEKKEKLSVGQEAAERIEKELGPSWTSLSWRKSASIIDKIIEERGLVPAGASLPQGQTRAETGEAIELLRSVHNWFMKSAPEYYNGCGLWIDVDDFLKENESNAALPVHKKGDLE